MKAIEPILQLEEYQTRQHRDSEMIKKIMDEDCYEERGGNDEKPGERFPNKRYFRRLADIYGLSSQITAERETLAPCNPDLCPPSCPGEHYEIAMTVRAISSETGRFQEGDGSCIDNEHWPIRRRLPTGKMLKASSDAMRKLDDAKAKKFCETVSGGRASAPNDLYFSEVSALLDYLFGNTPQLLAPRPTRNTRHNVRGTARTRALNRAISDLVAGGIVSAEEILAGDDPRPNGRQQKRTQQNEKPAATPAAQPSEESKAPPAEPLEKIIKAQLDTIGKIGKKKRWSDEQLADLCGQISQGRTRELQQLSYQEAGALIRGAQRS